MPILQCIAIRSYVDQFVTIIDCIRTEVGQITDRRECYSVDLTRMALERAARRSHGRVVGGCRRDQLAARRECHGQDQARMALE